MKNIIKDEFDKLEFSSNTSLNIKNNIYRKYKLRKRNNIFLCSFLFIFIVSITSLFMVRADEIRKSYNNLYYKEYEKSGEDILEVYSKSKTKINQNANLKSPSLCEVPSYTLVLFDKIGEGCYAEYTHDEIEDMLGISLIHVDYITEEKAIYDMEIKNDDKYSELSFTYYQNYIYDKGNYDETKPSIYFEQFVRTEYYNGTDIIKNLSSSGVKNDTISYYIKSIKTTGIIVKSSEYRASLIFDYNNIVYSIEVISDDVIDVIKEIASTIRK